MLLTAEQRLAHITHSASATVLFSNNSNAGNGGQSFNNFSDNGDRNSSNSKRCSWKNKGKGKSNDKGFGGDRSNNRSTPNWSLCLFQPLDRTEASLVWAMAPEFRRQHQRWPSRLSSRLPPGVSHDCIAPCTLLHTIVLTGATHSFGVASGHLSDH